MIDSILHAFKIVEKEYKAQKNIFVSQKRNIIRNKRRAKKRKSKRLKKKQVSSNDSLDSSSDGDGGFNAAEAHQFLLNRWNEFKAAPVIVMKARRSDVPCTATETVFEPLVDLLAPAA